MGLYDPPRWGRNLFVPGQTDTGRSPEVQGTNRSRQKGVRQALKKVRSATLSPGQKQGKVNRFEAGCS